MEMISPYAFPIIRHSLLNVQKYPYISKYIVIHESDVLQAVMDEFKVNIEFLSTKSRSRHLVEARMVVAYILIIEMRWTLKEAGVFIGGKDHTTIIHYRDVFRDLYKSSYHFKDKVDRVYKRLNIKMF